MATAFGQLVMDPFDPVGFLALAATGALCGDAEAGILEADIAFRHVSVRIGIEGDVVSAQELVAAAQFDIAAQHRDLGGAAGRVAGDVGRERARLGAGAAAAGYRHVVERGHRIADRAEPVIRRHVGVLRDGRQGECDGEGQGEQCQARAHASVHEGL